MTKNDDILKEQEPMAEVHKWQKKIEEEIKDLSPKERFAYFKKAGERVTAERKRLLKEKAQTG